MKLISGSFALIIISFFLASNAYGTTLDSSSPKRWRTLSQISDTFSPSCVKDTKITEIPAKLKIIKRGQLWTAGEEHLLLKLREDGVSWKHMVPYFTGRTWTALRSKYRVLTRDTSAVRKSRGRLWTDEEDKKLIVLVENNKSWEEMVEDLPGRSVTAMKARLSYLKNGLTAPETVRKRYTPDEDKKLLALRELNMPWEKIAESIPGRSEQALRDRYWFLRSPPSERRSHITWSSENDDDLKEALELGMSRKEIAELLNRTLKAVSARIRYLKQSGQLDPAAHQLNSPQLTVAEFELIREKRKEGILWKEIGRQYFAGRTGRSLMQQYVRYLKNLQAEGEEE